jgi:small subunit ribosomal protein S17e
VKSLGKQRSKVLHKKANEVYGMFPDKFSTDFEANKRALDELDVFTSKIDRNIVAGIIVKLAKPKEL